MNHDKHYSQKAIEPIEVIEETIERLFGKIAPNSAYNVGQSLKYILRAGLKDGESVDKDLDKALNYLTRGVTGGWRKDVSTAPESDFEALMRKYELNKEAVGYYTSACGLIVTTIEHHIRYSPSPYRVCNNSECIVLSINSIEELDKALDDYFN